MNEHLRSRLRVVSSLGGAALALIGLVSAIDGIVADHESTRLTGYALIVFGTLAFVVALNAEIEA
jgi:Protein of unknown function (DUF2964)